MSQLTHGACVHMPISMKFSPKSRAMLSANSGTANATPVQNFRV